jgi:hypothetical protein
VRIPPRLAMWLLGHVGLDGPFMGDLLEEYDCGRSSGWFWRQTVTAVLRGARAHYGSTMLVVAANAIVAVALTITCSLGLSSIQQPSLSAAGRVVHADSIGGIGATMSVCLLVAAYLFTCPILLVWRQYRAAMKTLIAASAIVTSYAGIVMIVSLIAPATIVGIGDNYCYGDWCMGVRSVQILPDAAGRIVKVDVRIFSDANHGTRSARGASVYMLDEHKHRFPLVNDSSNVPFDTALAPGQLVNTSLTFQVPGNAQHLFLTGDPASGPPIDWRQFVLRMAREPGQDLKYFTQKLNLGADFSLFHKHWMLQVT